MGRTQKTPANHFQDHLESLGSQWQSNSWNQTPLRCAYTNEDQYKHSKGPLIQYTVLKAY